MADKPIWQEIIDTEKKQRTGKLDLGRCGLTEIPSEVFKMTWLKVLLLSSYYYRWNEVDKKMEPLESKNAGQGNMIRRIPKEIANLTELNELYLVGAIRKIENLEGLHQLKQLDLGNNQITEIENLSSLTNLLLLSLDGNNIMSVGGLEQLVNLMALSLDYNHITELSNLERLVELRWLSAANNDVNKIDGLAGLSNLQQLNLSNNQLASCNGTVHLENIKRISLENNNISDFSSLKGYIKEGITLTLRNFSPFPDREEINNIYINNNPIVSPPKEVIQRGRDAVLRYFDSIEQAKSEALDDFRSKEVKVVMLGNSNVGKTHLATFLSTGRKKLPEKSVSTHGMNFQKFNYRYCGKKNKAVTIRLFDFGGQEYYHDTHHLFFTEDTVYFLLWEKNTNRFSKTKTKRYQSQKSNAAEVEEENYNFPVVYWLDEMDYIMKARRNSVPAINKINQSSEVSDDISKNLILVETKRDSDGWGFINTDEFKKYELFIHSLASLQLQKIDDIIIDTGINNILENFEEICDRLVEKKWSAYFGYIADFFTKLHQPGKPAPAVTKIIQSAGLKDKLLVSIGECTKLFNRVLKSHQTTYEFTKESEVEDVCRFLSNRGYIIYHDDNRICLYPQKLMAKIYEVLSRKQEGFISRTEVESRIGNEHFTVLEFMKFYNMLIAHPAKKDVFIAPQNLKEQADETVQFFLDSFQPENLRYRLLGFIHKGTMLQIFNAFKDDMVKDSSSNYFWKNGFVLKFDTPGFNDLIKIEFTQTDKERYIKVSKLRAGNDFSIFEEVEKKVEDVLKMHNYEKLISPDGKEFIGYNLVKSNADKRNAFFVYDDKQFRVADYKTFFRGITREYFMKKIFISYSSKDSLFMKRLETHLEPLKREGMIDLWHDRMIEPGVRWDDAIKNEMDESDIIIFLLSPDFLATSYIFEVEIPKALERQKNNQAKLFLVQLKPCRWKGTEFGDFQFPLQPITDNGKVVINISSFDNDEAWYKIVEMLEEKISNPMKV